MPRDLKKKFPTGSVDERGTIELLYDNLYDQLKSERIERTVGRSQAIVTDNGRIAVERMSGKWNAIGYNENKHLYLHYHEALYLIEMNRLALTWNSVVVSLEQGYALLLDTTHPNCSGVGIEEYVVYAQLQRCGFTVRLHSIGNDFDGCWSEASRPLPADSCVWKCLSKMLQRTQMGEDEETESPAFDKILATMNRFAEQIKLQVPVEAASSGSNDSIGWNMSAARKRAADSDLEQPSTKKCKRDTNEYRAHRYLDILLDDVSGDFEKIFHDINVIDVKAVDDEDDSPKLRFVFDVHPPNSEFKKTGSTPPKYRVIVVK